MQFNHLNLLSNFRRLFVTRLKLIETNDSLRCLKCFLGHGDIRHVGILFSFDNSARFQKKDSVVFFSSVVRFRLVILFFFLLIFSLAS